MNIWQINHNVFKVVIFFSLFIAACADSSEPIEKTKTPLASVDSNKREETKPLTVAFSADIDTDRLIDKVSSKHYLSPPEEEIQKNIQSRTDFEAYLKTLDPYSKYVNAEKVQYTLSRRILPRKGIGIDIIESKGKLLALPIKAGALYRSGFKTPHYLKSINGKALQFNDFESYRFLSTMTLKEKYSVELERNPYSTGDNYQATVELTRRPLHYTYQKGKTVVLGIKEFSLDIKRYLHSFFKQHKNTQHLVIDLRHCIGGSPYFTIDALSYFLAAEKKVMSYHSKALKKDKTHFTFAVPHSLKASTKITLLVSEFTASSAELFIHALKHYRSNITIVGKSTAGKCLAQKPFTLGNGDMLVLSIYELLTPDGTSCEGKPIGVDTVINDIELMPISHILQTVL